MQARQLPLNQSQLFLDDRWIEESANITREWHQPRKFPQPVLVADHPWERWCPALYGTVLHWRGKFRMWYSLYARDSLSCICYAESHDGVAWEKPRLGLCEFQGSKDNNILLKSHYGDKEGWLDCISVIDDAEDTEWTLKALVWDGYGDGFSSDKGIYALRSKDGIHWDRSLGLVLPGWGDRFNAVSTKLNAKYVIFGRAPTQLKGRWIWRTESQDLVHWSEPLLVLKKDIEDPPAMQYYSATAFPYDGALLGSLDRMHMSPDRIDTELIWSADGGRGWQRARTRPQFIPWGNDSAFDHSWINLASNGPIRNKGRLWFYYSGRSGGHSMPYPLNYGGIGLALLRVDGFASICAKEKSGHVLTSPIHWPDADLYVNVDPRRDLTSHPRFESGEVRVEVHDMENHPIAGFTFDECEPTRSNTVDANEGCSPVTWHNGRTLRELTGRVIRMAFHLHDVHLYSFCAIPAVNK